MNGKKISGLILMLIGAASIVFSCVVSGKVKQGQQKIERSQRAVNTVRGISNINPRTQEVGKIATQPAQRKINAGKKKVKTFRGVSIWGFVSGIVLAGLGIILFILGFCEKTHKSKKRRKR